MPKYPGAPSSTTGSSTSGGGSSTSGGGGTSRPDPNAMSGAEKRANAKEAKAKREAAAKYRRDASRLQGQVAALRKVLGKNGFQKALRQRLDNAQLVYRQQDTALMDSYKTRVGDLAGAAKDNEKAAGDQAFSNLTNRGRERANAVSEAMMQGAGESDLMRAQAMSLRNWSANQQEGNRAYYDGLRSINSALGDLNADTKTGRINLATQWGADRDALWTDYFNRQSQSYTELGNVLGQQADLLSSAIEMSPAKGDKKNRKGKEAASDKAFMSAADFASKAWKNPGVSSALMNWGGTADFEGENNLSKIQNAQTISGSVNRPEGATLRKW